MYKFDILSQDLFDCGERIYSTELAYRDLIKEHAQLKKEHGKLLDKVKEVKEWAGKEENQKKR